MIGPSGCAQYLFEENRQLEWRGSGVVKVCRHMQEILIVVVIAIV